jgi:hypothetical protein
MSHYKTKTQKRQQKNRSRNRRQRGRYSRRNQRGGSLILSPSNYSNQNNSHFSGIGFTDPKGAVTGCTGSTSGVAALKGADIYTTIGGITKPISSMNGGRRRGRGRGRMQRGGFHDTNGYSVGGVHLKPSLSGIANNYHTAYDSCKG